MKKLFKFQLCCIYEYFLYVNHTAQKMKFFIKDFFSKCDQIRRKLLWSKFQVDKIPNTKFSEGSYSACI